MPKKIPTSARVLLLLLAFSLLVGCASWQEEVVFPENYRDSYTKIVPCRKSAHPAANYVETWMSPSAKAKWDELAVQLAGADTSTTVVFPDGAVIVKVQFDDSKCEELANYTVMQKLPPATAAEVGDWKWQFVGDDGTCNNCDVGIDCASCHSACKPAPFMCSNPK